MKLHLRSRLGKVLVVASVLAQTREADAAPKPSPLPVYDVDAELAKFKGISLWGHFLSQNRYLEAVIYSEVAVDMTPRGDVTVSGKAQCGSVIEVGDVAENLPRIPGVIIQVLEAPKPGALKPGAPPWLEAAQAERYSSLLDDASKRMFIPGECKANTGMPYRLRLSTSGRPGYILGGQSPWTLGPAGRGGMAFTATIPATKMTEVLDEIDPTLRDKLDSVTFELLSWSGAAATRTDEEVAHISKQLISPTIRILPSGTVVAGMLNGDVKCGGRENAWNACPSGGNALVLACGRGVLTSDPGIGFGGPLSSNSSRVVRLSAYAAANYDGPEDDDRQGRFFGAFYDWSSLSDSSGQTFSSIATKLFQTYGTDTNYGDRWTYPPEKFGYLTCSDFGGFVALDPKRPITLQNPVVEFFVPMLPGGTMWLDSKLKAFPLGFTAQEYLQ